MTRILTGRRALISDLSSIESAQAMVSELERILPYFEYNRRDIEYLQNYYKGIHPIFDREKTVRQDIDNRIVVNHAQAATRDIVGYYLGKPIQYVHRDADNNKAITDFNRILDAENKNLVNTKIAQDQSITGTGYLGVFKDLGKKNGTSLKLKRLDPVNTFVVYSSDPDVDELYCCTFYTTQPDILSGEIQYTIYNIWTKNRRYKITDFDGALEVQEETAFSYGGYLPIQEYPNNMYRFGDWEAALSLMDSVDSTASERQNDIQQTVQAILVALGVDLTQDGVLDQLREDGLLNVPAIADGAMKPLIEYIGSPLDATVGATFSDYLEASMNVVIGIPDRKTKGGGGADTGMAVELRDGWMDIDLVASFKEGFFIESDRNALGAILYLLKTNKEFSGLEIQDIEVKFSRNKTANIQTKAQALTAFLGAGIHPQDAIEWCDLTTDVLSVVLRMQEYKDEVQQNSIDFAKKQQAELGVDEQQKPAVGSKTSTEQKKEPMKTNAGVKQ